MPGQIAQLIVPDDSGGNPQIVIPDWARSKIYFAGYGAIRSYRIALETQTPLASLIYPTYTATNLQTAGVDTVSGALLIQHGTGNGMPVYKLDPDSFAVIGQFGINTSYPSWPDAVRQAEAVIGVGCGTLASFGTFQVGYALIKESQFSGTVAVIRTDTMQQAGFYQGIVVDATDNRGFICQGASGPTGASVFLTNSTSPTPTLPLYTVAIAPGAETYNPASWPATNPYIHGGTVGTIAAASVDPTWTNLRCVSLGYDATDGNVLMEMTTLDAVTNNRYLTKVNANTAAVIWTTVLPTTVAITNYGLGGFAVDHNIVGTIGTAGYGLTATDTSILSSHALGGLILSLNFTTSGQQTSNFASDTAAVSFVSVGSYSSTATNAPVPVAGTPGSFGGYALVFGLIPPPTTLTDAELFFSPSPGFINFTDATKRRLFIAASGKPAWMGSDGALPFDRVPEVYLTTLGPPSNFAQNNGAGGAFAISGPLLAAAGPGCTPYFVTEAAGPIANPEWRLTVSDDGGRTWSTLVKPRSIGKLGEYLSRLRWLKMGQSRERMIRLECTDPIRRNIVGIYIDAGQGMT
jgi:hypothetical protein